MSRRTARGNRLGLIIVGALLIIAGVAAGLRGLDVAPRVFGEADTAVLEPRVRDLADETWFWPVVAVALVVVGLLALRWLLVQGRTASVRTVLVEPDPRRGSTRLPAKAATAALQDDLAASPDLQRASAGLTGGPVRPRLRLTVTLPPGADAAGAKTRIGHALTRHREALDRPDLPATVLLR